MDRTETDRTPQERHQLSPPPLRFGTTGGWEVGWGGVAVPWVRGVEGVSFLGSGGGGGRGGAVPSVRGGGGNKGGGAVLTNYEKMRDYSSIKIGDEAGGGFFVSICSSVPER